MVDLAVPFDRSYWVVPGKLLAGYYPGDLNPQKADEKLSALLQCGVGAVINLMEDDEMDNEGRYFVPYRERMEAFAVPLHRPLVFYRYAIRDFGVPSRLYMKTILDRVDELIAGGRVIYVHCWGGVGRTGTVVGCYLARHGIAVGQAALDKILELRQNTSNPTRPSPENEAQCNLVKSWETGE